MTTLTLRIEDDLASRLAERAKLHGTTLEEEAQSVIAEVLRRDWSTFWETVDRLRLGLKGKSFEDSAELIREDRDR